MKLSANLAIILCILNNQIVGSISTTLQESKGIVDNDLSSKNDLPKPKNTMIRRMQSSSSSSSSSSSGGGGGGYFGGSSSSQEECDDLFGCYEFCFSSHTTVDVMQKGKIQMNEIQVGDKVLTSKGKYETIYAIDHRHPTKLASFLQIFHSVSKHPLELTDKHMLFVEGNPNPVPAKSVKVGDRVQTIDGASAVTKISAITREGVFNPLTTDGTIVASGIISSTYSAYFSDHEWIEVAGLKIMTHQNFFSMALKPYMDICTGISLDACKTNNEKIAISQLGENAYKFWSQQEAFFQTISLCVSILIISLLSTFLNPYFAAIIIGWWAVKRNIKSQLV